MDCGNYKIALGSLTCTEKNYVFFLLVFLFHVTTSVPSFLWRYSCLHLGTKAPLKDIDKTILDAEEKEVIRKNIRRALNTEAVISSGVKISQNLK